jgi:hypothetical protein
MAHQQYCNVHACDEPYTHTTHAHLCKYCYTYGHDMFECKNTDLCAYLARDNQTTLPENMHCQLEGCCYKKSHTTAKHCCSICKVYGHSSYNCLSYQPTEFDKCPICDTYTFVTITSISCTDICRICMEHKPIVKMSCRCHMCKECILRSSENFGTTDFNNYLNDYKIDKYVNILTQNEYVSYITDYVGRGNTLYVKYDIYAKKLNYLLIKLSPYADASNDSRKLLLLANFVRFYRHSS